MVKERNYYQSLYEAAVALNSNRAPEDVVQSIVQTVAKAIGARACSLMLLTPDGKQLLHTASSGLSDKYIAKGPIMADRSISEMLRGKPIAILDAAEDERVQYPEEAKKEGITSILSVPMKLRDEVVGVLRIYTAKPYHFSADDVFFVGAVANLGAIALENARLYQALQKDYETFRQDMLAWRAAEDYQWLGGAKKPTRRKRRS